MGKRNHRSSRRGVYIGTGAAMAAMSFAVLQQANATEETEVPQTIDLKNGSFEESDNVAMALHWRNGGTQKVIKSSDPGVKASDKDHYLEMTGITEQDVPVELGRQLRFRLDYRAAGLTGGAYMATMSDPDKPSNGYQQFRFVTEPNKDWATIDGLYTVPAEMQNGKSSLRLKIGPQVPGPENPEILVDNYRIEYAPVVETSSTQSEGPVQIGSRVEVESVIHHKGGGSLLNPLFAVPMPAGLSYVDGSAEVIKDDVPLAGSQVKLGSDGRQLEIVPGTEGKMSPGTYKMRYTVEIAKEAADTFALKPVLLHQWAGKTGRDQDIAVAASEFTVATSNAQFTEGAGGFVKEKYAKGETAELVIPVENTGPDEAREVAVLITSEGGGITDLTGEGGECEAAADSPGAVRCSVAALPVGGKKEFKVKGLVSGSGVLKAQATLSTGSRQAARSETYTTSVDRYSAMAVRTSVVNARGEEAQTVEPGEELTFKTTLENTGPDKASSVVVSLDLPPGMTSDEPLPGTWTVGDLNAGETKELVFTAKAPADLAEFHHAATVTKWVGQDNSQERTSESVVKVNRNAKLDVAVTVDRGGLPTAAPVVPGTSLGYTVKITNSGPSTAGQVVVAQQLPEGFAPDPSYPPRGIWYDAKEQKWTVDAVPAGKTVELTLKGRVLADHPSLAYGARIEAASVPDLRADGGGYGELANHRASHTTEVTQQAEMNLTVERSKPKGEARPGEEAVWTVTASNTGVSTARGMEIANQLPEGVTLTSAKDADGKDVELEGAEQLWKPADLGAGESVTLTVGGTVPADRDTLDFTSSLVRAETADSRGETGQVAQHKAVNSMKVVQQADLEVKLTPASSGLKPGEKGTVTVTVSNAGPSTARSAVAELTLPENLAGVTDDGNGSFDPKTGSWQVGDLGVGDEKSLTLGFSSDKEQESTFTVLALSSAAEDPNTCVEVCASATTKISATGEAPGGGDEAQEEGSVLDQALAATGSNALWWGAGALGALGVGAAALLFARRRNSS
ncbi:DUF11 domain-containing protein [Streptomyces bambusae]|uniref:NEW3 domain-containing protein n=1 Tax=Streptomyces bambusae TaxID=1550616 RepID=UPI001CFE7549|nr:NEW3 domain-containing protein [Streptomyces bambusae]MCB5164700.1 DUF11 domain-containing protein [Streptomyces bambusae]